MRGKRCWLSPRYTSHTDTHTLTHSLSLSLSLSLYLYLSLYLSLSLSLSLLIFFLCQLFFVSAVKKSCLGMQLRMAVFAGQSFTHLSRSYFDCKKCNLGCWKGRDEITVQCNISRKSVCFFYPQCNTPLSSIEKRKNLISSSVIAVASIVLITKQL